MEPIFTVTWSMWRQDFKLNVRQAASALRERSEIICAAGSTSNSRSLARSS